MTDKGSKFKIYKQLIQLNKKTKQPNLKMGGRPEQTFYKDIQVANKHRKR